jgi:exopolyphosphatase/pppGpp-phosphohydrolase
MCVIDMGSNSFRRIVGSFDGEYRQQRIDVRTLGVGDDVSAHGRISDGKLADIESTLRAFQSACAADNASPIRAIGTAAFRDAPNAATVVAKAAEAGIEMEIATEQRESELAYLVGSLGAPGFAVVDNGSRSIELVADDDGRSRHLVFTLGYRVAYERFFAAAPDAAAAVAAMREALAAEAARAPFMKGRQKLVGVEFGEMADVLFDGASEGRVFTRQQLADRLRGITSLDAEGFARLKQTEDIDRALPRLVVALWAMDAFGYPELQLTARELGTGVIIEAGLQRLRRKS